MGWTVTYQLRRKTPLTAAEKRRLAKHVHDHSKPAWGHPYRLYLATTPNPERRVAYGEMKVTGEGGDIERLLAVLAQLRGTVPTATCEVEDDLDLVRWDRSSRTYELGTPRHRASSGSSSPDLDAGWTSSTQFLRDIRRSPVGRRRGPLDAGELYDRLAALDDYYGAPSKRLRETLLALDPLEVARAGLERYPAKLEFGCQHVLEKAMTSLEDPSSLRELICSVWSRTPTRSHYHADFEQYFAAVVKDTQLCEFLCAELFVDNEAERERRWSTVKILGHAKSRRAVAALCRRARQDRMLSRWPYVPWRGALVEALGRLRRVEGWPTIVLECAAHSMLDNNLAIEALKATGRRLAATIPARLVTHVKARARALHGSTERLELSPADLATLERAEQMTIDGARPTAARRRAPSRGSAR